MLTFKKPTILGTRSGVNCMGVFGGRPSCPTSSTVALLPDGDDFTLRADELRKNAVAIACKWTITVWTLLE